MKVIFSRKGFDSGYGKVPSPILEDGTLLSLPIPSTEDSDTMASLQTHGVDLDGLLQDLSRGKHSVQTRIHHDPELLNHRGRQNWRPALGQTGAAHGHLAKQGVGPGDVFLFFGWFRQVERVDGRWRYVRTAPDLHVLFGWLEVDEVLPIVLERERCLAAYPAIASHPHVASPEHYSHRNNHLYMGSERSRFAQGQPGGGYFKRFTPQLQLTAPGETRTLWSLPEWMVPAQGRRALTYHENPARWTSHSGRVLMQSVGKGQEFVLHCDDYPEARDWLSGIIASHSAP
ncbi:hypothetical protein ACI48D_22895 [Massilia sp. LXY-6]|uniref:Nmad3 family putative nucleotide modification protein n=1 Tax=Massilia sp. LXY-6 TaxID=3379823 RepID=UPI003EE023D9